MIFKVFGIFWHFAVLKLHAVSRRGLGAIATFSALSTLKTWFGTNSPSETIDHIVPEAMEQLGIERDELELKSAIADNGAMIFDNAPSMTFTKPLSVLVDGKPIPNPKWASLLHTILGHVKAKGFEGAKLV